MRSSKRELDFCGDLVRNVRPEQIGAWKDKRVKVVMTSTVNRDLNVLSSVFEAARRDWKWIHTNPCHGVSRPKDPPPRTRRVPDEDAHLMAGALGLTETAPITTTKQYTAVAFLLAVETAMRQGELVATTWPNVHLSKAYDAEDAIKRAVPLIVRRHRAANVFSWRLLHQIESEVIAEVSASGRHSKRLLDMLRSSEFMGYPKDDKEVPLKGHDVVAIVFNEGCPRVDPRRLKDR